MHIYFFYQKPVPTPAPTTPEPITPEPTTPDLKTDDPKTPAPTSDTYPPGEKHFIFLRGSINAKKILSSAACYQNVVMFQVCEMPRLFCS